MASHPHDEYREDCPDCQPVVLDGMGRRQVETFPVVQALRRAWLRIPLETKRRYFQFTVQNIHSEENFEAMREIQRYWNDEVAKEDSSPPRRRGRLRGPR